MLRLFDLTSITTEKKINSKNVTGPFFESSELNWLIEFTVPVSITYFVPTKWNLELIIFLFILQYPLVELAGCF